MSIEMDNPTTLIERVDAALNLVCQIQLALATGDIAHAKNAQEKAFRFLGDAMNELTIFQYSGAHQIAIERDRHQHDKGWTEEHDDTHIRGELIDAALSYIRAGINPGHPAMQNPPKEWPWEKESWKPAPESKRNLIKAGSLIAAEIDRLDRI